MIMVISGGHYEIGVYLLLTLCIFVTFFTENFRHETAGKKSSSLAKTNSNNSFVVRYAPSGV